MSSSVRIMYLEWDNTGKTWTFSEFNLYIMLFLFLGISVLSILERPFFVMFFVLPLSRLKYGWWKKYFLTSQLNHSLFSSEAKMETRLIVFVISLILISIEFVLMIFFYLFLTYT